MKKVILAYSGGLDTSCCIRWLKEKGYDVIAFLADLGQGGDFTVLKKRALIAGASCFYVKDLKEEFIRDFIFPALKANAIYESKYLLSAALGRPLIAKHLVEIAEKEKAKFVAHGCTGKGNDQVRLEVSISILDSKLKIIAPVREWELKSREEEVKYAERYKIPIEVTKDKPYSIDKNLWGVSIECGALEDPNLEPPEDAYQITKNPKNAPNKNEYLEIYFEEGIPKRLNGKNFNPQALIAKLNEVGAECGIGRTDLIEDRLIGIKSREVYEAPCAWILWTTHKELENLVLDREVLAFKELVSLRYAQLVYFGLMFTPLKIALDKFVDSTQKDVTGEVKVKLYKGNCIPVGRSSPYSLYKREFASYGPEDKFDQKLAEGFIKLWGMPYQSQKIPACRQAGKIKSQK